MKYSISLLIFFMMFVWFFKGNQLSFKFSYGWYNFAILASLFLASIAMFSRAKTTIKIFLVLFFSLIPSGIAFFLVRSSTPGCYQQETMLFSPFDFYADLLGFIFIWVPIVLIEVIRPRKLNNSVSFVLLSIELVLIAYFVLCFFIGINSMSSCTGTIN